MHTVLAGTLAGLLHVVSGPDHLVAVAPLALKRPLVGLKVGLTWGVGHACGVMLVGMAGVVLRAFVDIHALSRWAEFIVGFVLIGVGVWALIQMRRVVLHRHPHNHDAIPAKTAELSSAAAAPPSIDGQEQDRHRLRFEPPTAANDHAPHAHSTAPVSDHAPHAHSTAPASDFAPHAHVHVHGAGERHNPQAHQLHHSRGSYFVGLVHGAAGTGHLLGVLPSLALPPLAGSIYLVTYGIAAVIAMGGFGMLMGYIGYRLQPTVLRSTMLGCGMLAIAVGIFWLGSAWQQLG